MLPIIYPIIAASSEVTALIGSRFYPHGRAPQNVEAPYCSWFLISGVPENCLGEVPRVDNFAIQIDCWSDNKGDGSAEVQSLALAVRDALEPEMHMTNVAIEGIDPDTGRNRIGLQFTVFQDRDAVS